MEADQPARYRDEFYPTGFRKILALMLIVGVTVLPEVFSWVGNPAERGDSWSRRPSGMPTGRFGPSGGFLPNRRTEGPGLLGKLWSLVKRCLVIALTTAALVIYYPRRGFKRYALLCGPLIAIIVPWVVAWYLRDRTEVYRAEVFVVALIALAPGIGLYAYLTWRKARRRGMTW